MNNCHSNFVPLLFRHNCLFRLFVVKKGKLLSFAVSLTVTGTISPPVPDTKQGNRTRKPWAFKSVRAHSVGRSLYKHEYRWQRFPPECTSYLWLQNEMKSQRGLNLSSSRSYTTIYFRYTPSSLSLFLPLLFPWNRQSPRWGIEPAALSRTASGYFTAQFILQAHLLKYYPFISANLPSPCLYLKWHAFTFDRVLF